MYLHVQTTHTCPHAHMHAHVVPRMTDSFLGLVVLVAPERATKPPFKTLHFDVVPVITQGPRSSWLCHPRHSTIVYAYILEICDQLGPPPATERH